MTDKHCFICGNQNTAILEKHHIIPRRLDGPDTSRNKVILCGNCHSAIEKIYTDDVFHQLALKYIQKELSKSQKDSHQAELSAKEEGEDTGGESSDRAVARKIAMLYAQAVSRGWLVEEEHDLFVHTNSSHPELRVNITRSHNETIESAESSDLNIKHIPRNPRDCKERLKSNYNKQNGFITGCQHSTHVIGRSTGFDLNQLNQMLPDFPLLD